MPAGRVTVSVLIPAFETKAGSAVPEGHPVGFASPLNPAPLVLNTTPRSVVLVPRLPCAKAMLLNVSALVALWKAESEEYVATVADAGMAQKPARSAEIRYFWVNIVIPPWDDSEHSSP